MEEVEICETPNDNVIKEIELIEGNIKYKCEIQKDNDYLYISIYNNIIKYKRQLDIISLQYKLGIINYTLDKIFDSIYKLNNNKFNLLKNNNKYKLKIEFIILNKRRYLNLELYDDIDDNHDNNEYINAINELKELKEIRKELDNKIIILEEKLNKYKNKYDDTYDNFIIKDKEPKYILKYHTNWVNCSTVLKDGRFITGSYDGSIIVYSNKTFKPDLTIKEHNGGVYCILQLTSGELISCSYDKTIKLYNIKENEYNVIQVLKEYTKPATKIIELKNKQLVSCSLDKSIIFYNKDNNQYKKDYSFQTKGMNGPIIQTKDNELCYYEDYNTICFYDFIKRNNIKKINNINVTYFIYDSLLMISKDLLLITGENMISIINVNSYNLIKTINVDNSGYIFAACMLNKDMILTADQNNRIIQWKIEDDNLKLISIKENAHDDRIYTLSKLSNGLILSGSYDNSVKIW